MILIGIYFLQTSKENFTYTEECSDSLGENDLKLKNKDDCIDFESKFSTGACNSYNYEYIKEGNNLTILLTNQKECMKHLQTYCISGQICNLEKGRYTVKIAEGNNEPKTILKKEIIVGQKSKESYEETKIKYCNSPECENLTVNTSLPIDSLEKAKDLIKQVKPNFSLEMIKANCSIKYFWNNDFNQNAQEKCWVYGESNYTEHEGHVYGKSFQGEIEIKTGNIYESEMRTSP